MMNLSNLNKALGVVCLATVFSACVAQEQFNDVENTAKHYQKKSIEADRQLVELRAENARLKEMLKLGGTTDASSSIAEIDSRLAQLDTKLAELGANPGDVTKFKVDGGNLYQVADAILFELGSATLNPDGLKVLEKVVNDIELKPHGQISVRGHTDNVPVSRPETKAKFPHGNLQLSAERAVEVAVALTSMKSGLGDVVVMGYGDSRPVQANDSAENRKRNRRVEIFVADLVADQK